MKNLILSVIVVCGLGALVGCSCDDHKTSSTYESAQYDSKNMTPRHHSNNMNQ